MADPVRAHHIGSLLRPRSLRQAFREHQAGELGDDEFRQAQDRAIRQAVALQEQAGLRLVTDGEFRRASYWSHFVEGIEGLEVREALFDFHDSSGGQLAFTAPHVTGRLSRPRPISGGELAFLAQETTAMPKVTMPAPSTIHFWRGPGGREPGIYSTLEDLFYALAGIYRQEIADLAAAGATFVQLDEVALAMLCDPAVRQAVEARREDPEVLVSTYAGAIAEVSRSRPAGLTLGLHLCRGNYKGHWLGAGGYGPVAEAVFGTTGVDVVLLEFDSSRAGDFSPLRHVAAETQVVLGLVSSKTPQLESKDDLRRAIEVAGAHIPLERLALSPQCGFASTVAGNPLTEEDQQRKLELVVEVAQEIWGSA